jgi:protein required for attachment to host cells
VVCDGRKAPILENIGDQAFPNLHTKEIREHTERRTDAQGSDAPGRVHQSVGPARSNVEQTDWQDQEERAFLTALANRLHVALSQDKTPALIIAAAPPVHSACSATSIPCRSQGDPRGSEEG